MKFRFSEDIWEKISLLWDKERRQEAEEPDYSDKQVKELMKTLFLVRRACKPGKKQTYDMRQAWSNVVSRTKQRNTRKLVTWVFKYAAVLAVVICCAVLWMNQGGKNDYSVIAETDSIASGTRKAELILANGKSVILDSDMNVHEVEISGMKFVNDDKNGELRYDGSFVAEDSSKMSYNTLYIPKGGEYSLQLPDGSRVWLNSETSIRFPVCFMKDRRDVYLSGEAYFEVTKDTLRPFHVITDDVNVKVYGTAFSVNTHRKGIVRTTLVNGKVGVTIVSTGQEMMMRPNQMLEYDSGTGSVRLEDVDVYTYTAWKSGEFVFVNDRLEEIMEQLSIWYDAKVFYANEKVKNLRFTGDATRFTEIKDILSILEKTGSVVFEMNGRTITVYGKE